MKQCCTVLTFLDPTAEIEKATKKLAILIKLLKALEKIFLVFKEEIQLQQNYLNYDFCFFFIYYELHVSWLKLRTECFQAYIFFYILGFNISSNILKVHFDYKDFFQYANLDLFPTVKNTQVYAKKSWFKDCFTNLLFSKNILELAKNTCTDIFSLFYCERRVLHTSSYTRRFECY